MADRYIILGSVYNGDGMAPNEAPSAGSPGAWNQQSIITGTAASNGPALAAGDVVHIRSKTGNGANANISLLFAASTTFGSASATVASPITWILDDGTIWADQIGTLTFTTSSGSVAFTLRNYNRFISRVKHNWTFECTAGTPNNPFMALAASESKGLRCKQTNRGTNIGGGAYGGITYDAGYHEDFKLEANTWLTAGNEARPIFAPAASPTLGAGKTVFVNPEIEVTATGYAGSLFGGNGALSGTRVYGGRFFGAGAGDGFRLHAGGPASGNAYTLDAVGFQFPKVAQVPANQMQIGSFVRAYGLDGGTGSEMAEDWGSADTRNYTANYPYLNATLADSGSSPCTWRVRPLYATRHNPVALPITKLYTSAAAAKTVTLEMLVSDNWGVGVIDTNDVWMTVSYIDDATGNQVTQTTRAVLPGTALTSSSASWNTTSWGSVSFASDNTRSSGKRSLSLTTTGSIRQNTAVIITFLCSAKATSAANDIFMVDPDPQFT